MNLRKGKEIPKATRVCAVCWEPVASKDEGVAREVDVQLRSPPGCSLHMSPESAHPSDIGLSCPFLSFAWRDQISKDLHESPGQKWWEMASRRESDKAPSQSLLPEQTAPWACVWQRL